jgi:acetate kinase
MSAKTLVLVVNPGSASRKYALFADGKKRASIHFEFENNRIIGNIEYAYKHQSIAFDDSNFDHISRHILPLFREYNVIDENDNLTAIGIRVVAPSSRFLQDELITEDVVSALEFVQKKAPLHVTAVLSEIKQLKNYFPDLPIIAISDSAFHSTKPDWAWHYSIDTDLAYRLDLKRFGYHGISVGSVVQRLKDDDTLQSKTIVCHLGSGCSINAVVDGKSVDTTMGYTPLEGLTMSTRSGNIDISVAQIIKQELDLDDDGLEKYLNNQSGLLGISGSSDDIRQLLESEEQGDERAKLALKIFVYRIQQAIGQMAASMGGVDCIVFSATIGERSSIMRGRVMDNIGYLGFSYSAKLNDQAIEPAEITDISLQPSKPILVVQTNEAAEIVRRVEQYLER